MGDQIYHHLMTKNSKRLISLQKDGAVQVPQIFSDKRLRCIKNIEAKVNCHKNKS